jgi:hypothetical protein
MMLSDFRITFFDKYSDHSYETRQKAYFFSLILFSIFLIAGCATGTQLGGAAKSGNIKEVETLINKGADVNETGVMGVTPLYEALAYRASPDIVRLLLEKGADPNRGLSTGWRPIHLAVHNGDPIAVKLLLDSGAKVNVLNPYKKTPLQMAEEKGDMVVAQLLKEKEQKQFNHFFKKDEMPAGAPKLATSVDSDIEKVPWPVITDDAPYRALDFGSYHALVIGNNEYHDIKKLHTAVSDAQAINALLQDKYGFKTRLLLNATRADILRAINDYRRRLGPRDNLLIYYAGHGWLDKDADQGYWLPVDATEQDPTNWISNGSITDSLRAMEAKHVLVIADSCYSGKLSRGINIRVKTKNYYKKISVKKARTVMASGGLEPVADEGGKGTHSVFASALIEALNENQGVIDTTLLFSQIRRPVMVNTDQTPEYSDIRKAGHDGGDFLFVRQK